MLAKFYAMLLLLTPVSARILALVLQFYEWNKLNITDVALSFYTGNVTVNRLHVSDNGTIENGQSSGFPFNPTTDQCRR